MYVRVVRGVRLLTSRVRDKPEEPEVKDSGERALPLPERDTEGDAERIGVVGLGVVPDPYIDADPECESPNIEFDAVRRSESVELTMFVPGDRAVVASLVAVALAVVLALINVFALPVDESE